MMMDVNGYLIYRRRDTKHIVLIHGVELDNRWVVSHNVYLSTKYDVHINVEVCNNIHVVKFLFKYVYKGHDRGTVKISRQSDNATEGNVVEANEIEKYLNCRYVFASEAMWTSSSLICMNGFLSLSIYNTICLINKWRYSTMTMMCKKW